MGAWGVHFCTAQGRRKGGAGACNLAAQGIGAFCSPCAHAAWQLPPLASCHAQANAPFEPHHEPAALTSTLRAFRHAHCSGRAFYSFSCLPLRLLEGALLLTLLACRGACLQRHSSRSSLPSAIFACTHACAWLCWLAVAHALPLRLLAARTMPAYVRLALCLLMHALALCALGCRYASLRA